jgi:hypothetical protein
MDENQLQIQLKNVKEDLDQIRLSIYEEKSKMEKYRVRRLINNLG